MKYSINALIVTIIFIVTACTLTRTEAQTVYVTKTGSKYHKADCRYLKYSKSSIKLSEAMERGYTPCSVCRPSSTATKEASVRSYSPDTAEVKKESAPAKDIIAKQCKATTKAGSRCKRTTKNANQQCWQHQ
ncbi:hypothetical protein [Fulvivirga imtechensis]|uniref:hypothetical protein n=1 Tax=Fulvivirga imtechensis TaxID=881893 RepID=UPI000683F8F0|nr:hypothetical protein [Fulvivirga imtechensis]